MEPPEEKWRIIARARNVVRVSVGSKRQLREAKSYVFKQFRNVHVS